MEKLTLLANIMLTVVESAQLLRQAMDSELTLSLSSIKNETLYNLSLESPLLRDADTLNDQFISETWRGLNFTVRI